MPEPRDEIDRLLAEAADLPNGPAKVDVLAQAAAAADGRHDTAAGFAVRRKLLDAALGAGQPDQMTVAFTWCLAQSDRHPDVVPPTDILWQYRWVISHLPQFPQVPRRQIEDAIEDMTRRYRAAGSTLRPVHLLRLNTAIKLRDRAFATEAKESWEKCGRDWLSDDPRTEQSFVVDYLVFVGRDREAVDLCPQVLSGRADDVHFFGTDSAELLIPLLNLGRVADAVRVQRSGYRYISGKNRYLDMVGCHVEFLARIDRFDAAVKAFEDHVGYALTTQQLMDRFDFLRAALILVERLRRTGHVVFKLRLPKEVPVQPAGRMYPLADLAAWLQDDLETLAGRFDARNGNDDYAGQLRTVPDLVSRRLHSLGHHDVLAHLSAQARLGQRVCY
jgi:hypothetical protein